MSFLAAFIYRQFIHYPPAPTTSFKGRTVIVTGSNVGLGLEASRMIVRLGAARVVLACRNIEKGKAAARDIQATISCSPGTLEVWHLDMSSYASVIAFAEKVNAELPRLDVFLANAGLASDKFRITEDNEEMITTHVVSFSLLAFLILPKLRETAQKFDTHTHFTATGSEMHELAKFKERKAPDGKLFDTLNNKDKARMGDRYSVSKLLLMFIVRQMAIMLPLDSGEVIINSIAPGLCQSELFRELDGPVLGRVVNVSKKILCRPTEVGARTLVYGASAESNTHGQYLPDCKITPLKGLGKGKDGLELQNRVWVELKEKLEHIRPGVTSL
jgi:NAD(P)-dependent dehydrogenase (short-subunit alcohol dehydrogenase family)